MNKAIKLLVLATLSSLTSQASAGLNEGLTAFSEGNHSLALKELLPLANQGVPLAQLEVALIYDEGKGVPQDKSKSFEWMLKAADQGLFFAQLSVGASYFVGLSVEKNDMKAIEYYQRAANQ